MGFPRDSRLTTYSPGTVVRSADLNAIMDAIVGASHGIKTDVYGPEAFTVQEGSPTYIDGLGGPVASGWDLDSTAKRLHASIDVPEGAIIESITVYGENLVASSTCDINLVFASMSSPFSTATVVSVGTAGSGPAAFSVTYTGPVTRNPQDQIKMRVDCNGSVGSTRFTGFEVEWYMP